MDRRKTKRIRARASVGYIADRAKRPALTYDLSTRGCMLQLPSEILSQDDQIELSFGGGVVVKGTVVWVRHRNAGVQFAAPLSPSAVRKILLNVVGLGLKTALSRSQVAVDQIGAREFDQWRGGVVSPTRPNASVGPNGTLRHVAIGTIVYMVGVTLQLIMGGIALLILAT